jgi:NDMA-dependent alcohol dehydrogenase
MKSLAAVTWGRGLPWEIEEIDVAPPARGEVLVEWAAAGLCHSDEHVRSGERVTAGTDDEMYPLLGGHEGAGVVAATGPGISSLAVGDHVCGAFAPSCGKCRYCVSGRGFICNAVKGFFGKGQLSDGSSRHSARGEALHVMGKLGTFSERTVVAEQSLVRIDPQASLAAAALVSCGVATGWGSAVERAGTRPGDVVVVVGVGGLGISAVQGARMVGAAEIIAVDPIAYRREQAKRFGATRAAAGIQEAVPAVTELTWGQGADRVILTPSIVSGDLIREGLDLTAKGGVCVVTGVGPIGITSVPLDIGMFVLYNKELRGCLFGSMDPRASAPRLLDLYRHGLLNLDDMITTYPLRGINEGYQDTLNGRNIRGVVLHSSENSR